MSSLQKASDQASKGLLLPGAAHTETHGQAGKGRGSSQSRHPPQEHDDHNTEKGEPDEEGERRTANAVVVGLVHYGLLDFKNAFQCLQGGSTPLEYRELWRGTRRIQVEWRGTFRVCAGTLVGNRVR